MYFTICEIDHKSRLDAGDRVLRAGTGTVLRDGTGREESEGVRDRGQKKPNKKYGGPSKNKK